MAQGTYYPDQGKGIVNNDRNSSFVFRESVFVLGGFPSGGGGLELRNWKKNKTILCGEIQQDKDSSNNSYHIVKTNDSNSTIDGFYLVGGNANEFQKSQNSGGGAWLNNSNPTIKNCMFYRNSAIWYGGAILNQGSPKLINCILSANRATSFYNDQGYGGKEGRSNME
ncbi:MAG: hypothetical protein IPO69_09110 [Saprospiraceae bacterium]|nr:hypothetical protein [Saprospiraceae bacterium]